MEAKDELKEKLLALSVNALNQSDQGVFDQSNQSRVQFNMQKTYEIKKFSEAEEKVLNQNIIENMPNFIEEFQKKERKRWSVARGLVTTMIEVNYNLLQMIESEICNKASSMKNHIKIRFLQPAQDFYNQLMDNWILLKINNNRDIVLSEFIERAKDTLGNSWSESLINPTKFFFQTLKDQWQQIKEQDDNENDAEIRIRYFVRRVREDMIGLWDENIVQKASELEQKLVQHHSVQ